MPLPQFGPLSSCVALNPWIGGNSTTVCRQPSARSHRPTAVHRKQAAGGAAAATSRSPRVAVSASRLYGHPLPQRCPSRPRPAPSARGQKPMHQFTRLPPLCRQSGPEVDIIDLLPEPHAPIRPSSGSARQSLRRRKQPMQSLPPGACPGGGEAHRHAPMPGHASPFAGQCGTRQSKKDSTQMQKRCTRSTQMGLGPAPCFTANIAQLSPGSRADAAAPVPSACIRVHLTASALSLSCSAAYLTLPRARAQVATRQPQRNAPERGHRPPTYGCSSTPAALRRG